jgi:methylamine dehydrogenase heavy chain
MGSNGTTAWGIFKALLYAMTGLTAVAHAADPPPILAAETSDVAILPPPGPHRVLVGSSFMGGVRVFDGDSGEVKGQFYTGAAANFAIDPNNLYYYVAETMWSHGNRGTRADLLSIYDNQLKFVTELPLPGRLVAVPKSPTLGISGDGHWAYVYNMQPASSVAVVDLQTRKLATVVETPGCGMIYPWQQGGFSLLCADGTVASATSKGRSYTVTHSAPFFDAEQDPVFEESLVDRTVNRAFFITYTGQVFDAQLAPAFHIDHKWSLQQAAGLPAATSNALEYTWRPGGAHFAAYHRATGLLYVLMHVGPHWSHKADGTEVWVFDTRTQQRVRRIVLPAPASVITVSQDGSPLLFAVAGFGAGEHSNELTVMNAATGEVLHSVKGASGEFAAVMGF